MERTIDRTSYRRSARYEAKKVKESNEKNFSYIKILLNQIIVSLLIIISILTLKYFDITIVDNWLNENINNDLVFSSEGDTIWVCRNCGHIVIGKKAPEICPVCSHAKSFFERKANNY